MFVIPFLVEAAAGYQYTRFGWRLDTSSVGAVATAIYAKLSNDSLTMFSPDIYLELRVASTFEASRRGVQAIVLVSAQSLQFFPETSSRAPFFLRSDNQTINSIHWTLNERKTITLSYVDQQVASLYEFIIIFGGLLLGTGVSGTVLASPALKIPYRLNCNQHSTA